MGGGALVTLECPSCPSRVCKRKNKRDATINWRGAKEVRGGNEHAAFSLHPFAADLSFFCHCLPADGE